uniref:Ciliary microtubule inner protein 2A-C-like domain-containing protein n=1 Tax=Chelonoidis abingdonii TaxID=106734 RepID=A0A8C0GB46_CHEAB
MNSWITVPVLPWSRRHSPGALQSILPPRQAGLSDIWSLNHNHKIFTLYGGFYPQIRYQIGETYGKTTSRLLTDPSVLKSPCSVLAPLVKPRFLEDFSGTKHPSNQMLDQNYSYFPGYTAAWSQVGCLPASPTPTPKQQQGSRATPLPQGHSWCPSAIPCPRAEKQAGDVICGLWQCWEHQRPKRGRRFHWHLFYFGFQPVRIEGVPLDAVTETVDLSRYNQLPKLDVPNLIQRKAISGYTGFVPRFTWIMGVNYLKGVKDAMNEFDRNQFMVRNPAWNFGKRLPRTYWPNNKIYTSAGLIPFYTGFVPSNVENYEKRMELRTESCGTHTEGWRGDEEMLTECLER